MAQRGLGFGPVDLDLDSCFPSFLRWFSAGSAQCFQPERKLGQTHQEEVLPGQHVRRRPSPQPKEDHMKKVIAVLMAGSIIAAGLAHATPSIKANQVTSREALKASQPIVVEWWAEAGKEAGKGFVAGAVGGAVGGAAVGIFGTPAVTATAAVGAAAGAVGGALGGFAAYALFN